MIAIYTNVLLRYLLDDDATQSPKAARLIKKHQYILITDVVLSETIWTLIGKRYSLGRQDISKVIYSLFQEPNIHFENDQVIWKALSDYNLVQPVKSGKKKKTADFQDALIVNKAKSYSNERSLNLEAVYTFDVAAQEIIGTKKP